MRAIHVLAVVNIVIWGLVTIMSRGLLRGVEQQHVNGFPNSGQIAYYLYFPCAVFAAVGVAWLLRGVFRRSVFTLEVLAAALVLPYMFFYTGGM